jgi:hypothetical protein
MHRRNKPAPRNKATQQIPTSLPTPEPQIIQQVPAPEPQVTSSMRRPIKPAPESRVPLPMRRTIKPDQDSQITLPMCRPVRSTRRPIPSRNSLVQAFRQVLAQQNDVEYITLSSGDEDDNS